MRPSSTAPGFGQDTITGFLAPTSAGHDHLQFSHTMFGFSSTATQTADATALLSKLCVGNHQHHHHGPRGRYAHPERRHHRHPPSQPRGLQVHLTAKAAHGQFRRRLASANVISLRLEGAQPRRRKQFLRENRKSCYLGEIVGSKPPAPREALGRAGNPSVLAWICLAGLGILWPPRRPQASNRDGRQSSFT